MIVHIFGVLLLYTASMKAEVDDKINRPFIENGEGVKNYALFNVRENKSYDKSKSDILEKMMKTPTVDMDTREEDILGFQKDQYPLPKPFTKPLQEYDFIIVGAGSAGSALAARLSATKMASVLLLEAGDTENLITDTPALAPLLQQTDYVWPYLMEHQPGVCMGMTNERCFWPRGKAVGGSSVANYMIYTRGLPVDWDRIAADGNPGWSYKDVLPYYIRSERARLRGYEKTPWHGRFGELPVQYVPFRSKLSKAFLDSAKYLGNRILDYNSPDGFGFNYIQATIDEGRRCSSAKAFLYPHRKRKNLHILPKSTVTKILINETTKIAYGVQFTRFSKSYTIYAKKEVILSAGPIESPHLLMLSGIGPKKHLESFNINVVSDLKVGEVLYDHISFPGLVFKLNTSGLTMTAKRTGTVPSIMQFLKYGEGPLSTLAGVETIGYIKTNVSEEIGEVPDIELLGSCSAMSADRGIMVAKGLHISEWLYNDYYRPMENQETFTILFMLLHPKSVGHLKLNSTNPFDQPKLYGNYLTHKQDIATMIAAIRYIIKMVETPPFQQYGATLYKKKYPNCKDYNFNSDNYWECVVRTMTATLHHQIATCKMGPTSDPYAIVDQNLKVYGTKNLRVVDSSVIPRTTVAHTNAPAIMIGEKAADIIIRTWNLKTT